MAILDLPTNTELLTRNQQRADECKLQMGRTYLCHPDNRVLRIPPALLTGDVLGRRTVRQKGGVR